jgi:hypothetical protein
MRSIPLEVFLAAGYAIFLVALAALLEWVAKHSHRRTDQLETVGFRYHPEMDRWQCPVGTHLVRIHTHEHHVARYRAPAHACNSCPIKRDCTDSDQGREIEHHLDLWIRTGIGRFHAGISLALLLLAALLLAVEAGRYPQPHTLLLTAGLLAPITQLWMTAFREFCRDYGSK